MKKENFALDESTGRGIMSLLSAIVIAIVCIGLFSFTARSASEAVFQRLGMSQSEADQNISQSILQGYLSHAGARNLKSIAIGDRAAAVKDLMLYAKQYTKSDAFQKQYEALRTQQRPQAPAAAESEEDIRSKMVSDLKKSIKSTEESMAKMNDETKKMMAESLAMLKAQLKEYENPNSEMVKMLAAGSAQTNAYEQEAYKEKLVKWQKQYPADAQAFVKVRLQQFLNETKDIDFNAALKDSGRGKMKFVNPAFEAKSSDWKKAFRAGKDATTTARQIAQQWLQEPA
ncbi:hypothetical protein [Pontibacter cellulosilyticus]|uniref:Uncharacterized protein n=1 Tax=Pontibacter cellulosilyticus TaxID=1720253 RepID=A0A923N6R8_9BACT|nr:hypothetical protein [Pontibacter cellulosilyticus]MBC5993930.1 hypothetical protein [Pontibacter cellulosilyticus]